MIVRALVGTAVVCALLRLSVPESASLVTIVQHDRWRGDMDPPCVAVSGDGRFVAFTSYAQLVPADTNARRDVYVFDRDSGGVTLESVAPDGDAATTDSEFPSISADGRFLTYGTYLETTPSSQIVLRDRRTATTSIISRSTTGGLGNGWSGRPTINADGTVIAFMSVATDLVAGDDANGTTSDIYLYRRLTGTMARVSVDSAGVQASSGVSVAPSVSADGRYVAFASNARLGQTPDAAGAAAIHGRAALHVYLRDTRLGITRQVDVNGDQKPDGMAWAPGVAADGGYVVFTSEATNLAPNDRNRSADIFIADLRTGRTEMISRSVRGGAANGRSGAAAISADGRVIAFQSEASDLVCARGCDSADEDINLLWDVFLLDRATRTMARLSTGPSFAWMESSGGPALDWRGDVVAFSSRHPINIADERNDFDLFVRTGEIRRSQR